MGASQLVNCNICIDIAVVFLVLLACRPFAKTSVNGIPIGVTSNLPYITAYQSSYSGIDDEYVGPPISIPSGLPFGNSLHYKAYVGANGIISLSKPFNYYQPSLFPSSRPEIRHSNVLAPFWNDIDVTNVSSVSVGVHSIYNSSLGSENYVLLMSVNSFVQTSLNLNEPFSGKWMLVVTWNSTRMFPSSALRGTSEYNSLSQESRELLKKENTFQAIVVTDYTSSYAVFTYRCGDLNSPGFQHYSTIGINADNAFSFNHQLSGYEAIIDVSCANGEWNNLVYELNRDSRGRVDQSDSQRAIGECWNYYVIDTQRDATINSVLFSDAVTKLPKCPCSESQVINDLQFYIDPDNSNCYISRFYESMFGLGVHCCYQGNQDTGFTSSKQYVSYIRHHPKFSINDNQFEVAYQSACCDDITLGVCELYYSRRAIRSTHICSPSKYTYTPPSIAWSGGGHHIRTPDGLNYTFNGVGEYALVEHPRLRFQGRMIPGYPGTTYFSAFVVQYDNDRVQIEFNTRLAGDFYVGHTDTSSSRLTEIDYFYSSSVEVIKYTSYVTVIFANGPSIVANLSASGYLDFVLFVGKIDLVQDGTPYGLLGNFNNEVKDDMTISGSLMVLPYPQTDRGIHSFAQSWQVNQSESLFDYLPGQTFSTYSDPSFVPTFLKPTVSAANNVIREACSNNILCIYEAVTTGMIKVGIDTWFSYKTYQTINDSLADLPPYVLESFVSPTFNILLIPNSRSCFSLRIFDNDNQRQDLHVSVRGSIDRFASLMEDLGIDTVFCYTFGSTVPDANEFSSLTFIVEDGVNNIVTYTPLTNVCPCSSNGRCPEPLDSEFQSRVGNVLIQDCVCDSLPNLEANIFPFGEQAGDINLPSADDTASGVIDLSSVGFPFYGANETILYVNYNGVLNFRRREVEYGPNITLPFGLNPLIAPFWHDIDTRRGGNIYYRLSDNIFTLAEAHSYLISLYSIDDPDSPNLLNFYPSSIFISTWDKVPVYESSIKNASQSLFNTFQVALVTNGEISYVLFIYKDIQWGNFSTIGFQSSNGTNIFELPFSRSEQTVKIDTLSNVGRAGVFVYRVDGQDIRSPIRLPEELRVYDGQTCTNDIDGCSLIGCLNGGLCNDAAAPESGVYCPSCPDGYAGIDSKCYDIDECEGGFDTCGDGSGGGCVNTIGSYECGCANGFVLDGDNQCMEIDQCLVASRNGSLDSLCPPHQRCLQRDVMDRVCVCPPFTLKYRGYTDLPECIVHPVGSEGSGNFITVTLSGLDINKFFLEGYLDSFMDATSMLLINYCSTQTCTTDQLIPLSSSTLGPARRKRAATISAFDDIRVIVDFEDVDLEQTGNEFNFTFYIEVTLSGDEFVVQETLELLVFQSGISVYLDALPSLNSLMFSITNPDLVTSTQTELPSVTCPAGNDPLWWLLFPTTLAESVATQACPQNGTSSSIGVATRLCMFDGEWDSVDTSNCTREDFAELAEMAAQVFSNNASNIDPNQVEEIIEDLVVATDSTTTGGSTVFATDLDTTNTIVNSTVKFLLENLMSDNALAFNEEVLDVINNVLDESNMEGWQELQEDSAGSQQLLLNAEGYGQYVAAALMADNIDTGNVTDRILERKNIVIRAKIIDKEDVDDVLFPDKVNVTEELGSAQTRIPANLLRERGAENGSVSAINVLFSNLELFLPKDKLETNFTTPVTQIISTQLLSDLPVTKFDTLAVFNFTTRKFSDDLMAENPRCASWNFSGDVVESSWSTEGVMTVKKVEDPDTGVFKVECHSNHFTAFAVLMDVTGALNDTSEEIRLALTVVTYVGCSISIFFLLVTIVYLLTLWKELFTKLHFFVHLNLAIALLLGYVVFIAGVDTAVVNRGLCVFVAALLHYLFTAVFFWMLCEGIMLYLMLVTVFSQLSTKWWLFLLLGWGVPLIPVAISVGVIHDQYGTDTYCWIAVGDASKGAIWAFVAPMLVVTVVNVFFLLAALRSVYKQKTSKMKGSNSKSNRKNLVLFKQLFMATIILLPLLGLTWVFGLLTVGDGAEVFAWLFTICNSLQGFFIFVFHVLRSEKVWNLITRPCGGKKDDSLSSMARRSTNSKSVLKHQSRVGTNVTSIGSRMSTLSYEHTDGKGFQNPMFESVVQDETTLQEEPETIGGIEKGSDFSDIDESMFEGQEKEGSLSNLSFEMEPDGGEDSRWKYTLTLNWKKSESQESLNGQLF